MTGRVEWPWRPVKGYAHGEEQRELDLREDDGLMAVSAIRSMSDPAALVLSEAEAEIAQALADTVLVRLAASAGSAHTHAVNDRHLGLRVREHTKRGGDAGAEQDAAGTIGRPDFDERRLAVSYRTLQRLTDLLDLRESQVEALAVDDQDGSHGGAPRVGDDAEAVNVGIHFVPSQRFPRIHRLATALARWSS